MKKATRTQSMPIELSAVEDYDSGRITLHIAGEYAATLQVTELTD